MLTVRSEVRLVVIVATVLRRPEEISEFIDIYPETCLPSGRNVISAVDGLRPMRKIMMSMWYGDIEIKKPAWRQTGR
jgi:hypothetical protein